MKLYKAEDLPLSDGDKINNEKRSILDKNKKRNCNKTIQIYFTTYCK